MPPSAPPTSPSRPRWLLLGLIIVTALAALAVIWLGPNVSREHKSWRTVITVGVLFACLLLWLLGFSRLPWRTRRHGLVLWVILGAGLAGSFHRHGHTGDLVPIYEWRWWGHEAVPAGSNKAAALSEASAPGLADYAQFLGPERQGRLPGPQLARDWKQQAPELLWKNSVGPAWSAFAVAGHRAVTQEQRGEDECVVCYDVMSGGVVWEQRTAAHFGSSLAGEGPRATPTIEGDRCYTQGATGRLQCLDLATGAVIWFADVVAAGTQSGTAKMPDFGFSASPCIEGSLVLVAGPMGDDKSKGCNMVAFDKGTGKVAWKSGLAGGGYSSVVVGEFGAERQALCLGPSSIDGCAVADGAELWSHHWPPPSPHVCMPLLLGGDEVLVSSGYGLGSVRLHVSKKANGTWSAAEVWRSNKMKPKFSNLVRAGEFVYGLDEGVLACLDLQDGKLRWRDGKYGHGQVTLVGALLLLTAEDGDVVLLDPQPEGRRELTRFTALSGKTWNPAALAGRYLVVRNDQEAACYRLPVVEK